jgi:hypothetical protein
MPVQTRSQKTEEMPVVVKADKSDRKTRSADVKPKPKKTFYDWVPVDPNEVEKPFAGKEYEEAAASREEIRALNASTPIHKVVKTKRLAELGLTPNSRDPTGMYKIVIPYYKLGIGFDNPKDKWAIAPPGYSWCECSDSDYYNYDWCELREIPTPEVRARMEEAIRKEKEKYEKKGQFNL